MTKSDTRKGAGVAAGLVLASAALMGLLHKWEEGPKRQLTVYADKLAGGLPTVCSGITRHITTTPIIVGETWTEEKCEREERAAAAKIQREILGCFERTPPQEVFDAASSHAWNFGAPKTCGSQAMQQWNAGNWAYGCLLMAYTPTGKPNWSSAGGRFYPGLFNRRKDEMAMCLSGLGR